MCYSHLFKFFNRIWWFTVINRTHLMSVGWKHLWFQEPLSTSGRSRFDRKWRSCHHDLEMEQMNTKWFQININELFEKDFHLYGYTNSYQIRQIFLSFRHELRQVSLDGENLLHFCHKRFPGDWAFDTDFQDFWHRSNLSNFDYDR